MKRKLLTQTCLKHVTLAVPAAALMLGAAQAGTTVGINYTVDWAPYNYGYSTTGFNVTAKAFGVDVQNWVNSTPLPDGGPVSVTITSGALMAASTASNPWSSGIGNLNPDPNGPGYVTPGDDEVTWSYLDDTSPGWSVALSGLNATFPNGYVIQTIGVPYAPPAPNVNITDSATFTNTLTYTDLGNGTALSVQSEALTLDAVNIIGAPRNGSHRSTLAGFIVTDRPVVSQKPVGGDYNSGATISLSAGAIGLPPVSYQWYVNGAAISGATSLTYSKAGASSGDSGAYTLVASNAYGSGTSIVAQVSVLLTPTIVVDLPGAVTNYLSLNERFSVVAGGQEPLSYQWYKGAANIPNATNAILSLVNLQAGDAAGYKVVVTNSIGSVTSSIVSLNVLSSQPPYEGFSYAAGSLTGQGGGVGWNGPWTQEAGYNGDHSVFASPTPWRGGLNELVSSGGALQLGANGSADFEDIRNLQATLGGGSGGTLYMSFVCQVTNAGWGGVELVKDGTAQLFLGSCWYFSAWGWGNRAAPDATTSVVASTLALLVYRFDFTPTNTTVRLYANPPFLSTEPATANATGSEAVLAFNQIRIVTHNANPNGVLDEFRIGGTWASVTPHTLRTDAAFSLKIVPGGLIQDTKPAGVPHPGYNYGSTWTNSVTDSAVTPVTRTGVEQFSAAAGSQITIPTNSDFNSANGTICFWMLAGAPLPGPGNEGAMLFDRRTTSGAVIVLHDDGSIFWQGQGGARNSFSAGYLPDGNWHHVAVTYGQTTNDTLSIYVDGLLAGSVPVTNAWAWPTNQEIEIGRSHDSYWRRFDGFMDDFRMYSRVLTDTEIGQVYSGGALVDTSALKVEYTFGSAIYGQSLVWPYGTLLSSLVLGPGASWTPVPGATSPLPFVLTEPAKYYRLLGQQ
jgi:hypothetical protein